MPSMIALSQMGIQNDVIGRSIASFHDKWLGVVNENAQVILISTLILPSGAQQRCNNTRYWNQWFRTLHSNLLREFVMMEAEHAM